MNDIETDYLASYVPFPNETVVKGIDGLDCMIDSNVQIFIMAFFQ